MAEIEPRDVVARGLSLLPSRWADKPNVQGLLKSYLQPMQDLEDALFQLNNERGISSAIGQQLDILGLLVGEQRAGRSDEEYRLALKLRIAINNSEATEASITEVMIIATGVPDVKVMDKYPAGILVEINGIEENLLSTYLGLLQEVVAVTILPAVSSNFDLIFDTGDTLQVSQNPNDNFSVYTVTS